MDPQPEGEQPTDEQPEGEQPKDKQPDHATPHAKPMPKLKPSTTPLPLTSLLRMPPLASLLGADEKGGHVSLLPIQPTPPPRAYPPADWAPTAMPPIVTSASSSWAGPRPPWTTKKEKR